MNNIVIAIQAKANQIMSAQAVNANNLANSATDGFVAEMVHYGSGLYRNQQFSMPDMTRGPIQHTGREMDISLQGEGWIAVLNVNGEEAYSRRGDLKLDSNGLLIDGAGRLIQGNNGPIALPPYESITIGDDGTITIRPLGAQSNNLAIVDRIKLVNPPANELIRGPDGLFISATGIPAEADASIKIQVGDLEGSNVSAVGELLKMMDMAREFEANFKLMQDVDENAKRLNSLLRIS
jgi:flagellar basal-body rod protein FlgF